MLNKTELWLSRIQVVLNRVRGFVGTYPQGIGQINLNLGCGERQRIGWINVDIDGDKYPDVVADATDLKMFDSESVNVIDCCHIFEHFTYTEALEALNEWFRVLKKNGRLYLELPNFGRCVELLMVEKDNEAYESAMVGVYGCIPDVERDGVVQLHKYGWTIVSLSYELSKVGFKDINVIPVSQKWRKATKFDRDMRLVCVKR